MPSWSVLWHNLNFLQLHWSSISYLTLNCSSGLFPCANFTISHVHVTYPSTATFLFDHHTQSIINTNYDLHYVVSSIMEIQFTFLHLYPPQTRTTFQPACRLNVSHEREKEGITWKISMCWLPSTTYSKCTWVYQTNKMWLIPFKYLDAKHSSFQLLTEQTNMCVYTGFNRRNGPDFGRVFLMLNYTKKPQNTYIQSWMVSEIMASEVWNFDSCYTLTDYQIHIETGRDMWFL